MLLQKVKGQLSPVTLRLTFHMSRQGGHEMASQSVVGVAEPFVSELASQLAC